MQAVWNVTNDEAAVFDSYEKSAVYHNIRHIDMQAHYVKFYGRVRLC